MPAIKLNDPEHTILNYDVVKNNLVGISYTLGANNIGCFPVLYIYLTGSSLIINYHDKEITLNKQNENVINDYKKLKDEFYLE